MNELASRIVTPSTQLNFPALSTHRRPQFALSALALGCLCLALPETASAQTKTFYLDRAQVGGAPDDGMMVWRPVMHEHTRVYATAFLGGTLNPLRNGKAFGAFAQGGRLIRFGSEIPAGGCTAETGQTFLASRD